MLEITANDIAALSDTELRSLVGLLCESEARRRGFSSSFITWGGHQDAADGGLDVRVALPSNAAIDGFIPRPATGFQVKKTDMPRTKILEEMRPFGVLRPVIRDLADRSGAYIIVSSEDFTSDAPLQNRRTAMRDAVIDLPNAYAIALDFYDRGRLATWVRDHAGLIMWVKEKIGRPIRGWSSYGAWAYDPEGAGGLYLLDDKVRIVTDTLGKEGELETGDGIGRIRDRLLNPRAVVRLVGLSGVGKTRLAQALFDNRVGNNSLDPTLACYTDVAHSPEPPPLALASELIATRKKAILIIDNCPPDLHGRLSELCRAPDSLLSLISIEYDIQDDQPEGTEVFRLKPSSADLIEKLVRNRFPEISPVGARVIAESSDGNARVAIALAGAVGKNEAIVSVPDHELFKRLFDQRNEPSESLLLAAQALALVYSFQGDDTSEGDEAELFRLGALIGKSPLEMYQSAAELRRRDLVQQRGVWRAVLPHAIANRLAAIALQNIPSAEIEGRLVEGAPARLLKSFSRRLGYLNTSKEAQSIVKKWLKPGGLLEDISNLNDLGYSIFSNVAPVAPEYALSALERVLLKSNNSEVISKCHRYVPLLRSLAYDAAMFERCLELLLIIAGPADVDSNRDDARKVFASLFTIYFSGTQATIEQRLSAIQSLLLSDDPKQPTLGVMALRAALQASNFGPAYNFEFGVLLRDYGYWPRTADEVKRWFASTLQLAESVACSNRPPASQVRTIVAEQFRGLWATGVAYEYLERVFRAISEQQYWPEGWSAVRQTIHYDSKGFAPGVSARIASLEESLRPKDLVQRVRSIVLSESVIYAGLDSMDDSANDIGKTMLRVEAAAYDLGRIAAVDKKAFSELLPELVAGNSQQLWSFGRGLAESSEDPSSIWGMLVTQRGAAKTNGVQVFRGFLFGLNAVNAKLVTALLDDAVENETLADWYPVLQTAVGIDREAVERLVRSLELGKAWIGTYRNLVAGGVSHPLAGRDFNSLLLRIAAQPGGLDIAIEILCMRLSFEEGRRNSSPSEIIDVGCELMRQLEFTNKSNDIANYRLGIVGRNCLVGDKGAATAQEVCRNLTDAISKSKTYAFYQTDLLQILFAMQPLASLEALCGGDAKQFKLGMEVLDQAGQLRRNPFDAIPDDDLLSWCDRQPEIRYPAVAVGVTAFRPTGEAGRPQWTSIARKLLGRAPDRVAVLKKLARQLAPDAWSGSYRVIVESNAKLLDDLATDSDLAVAEFIKTEKIRLAEEIESKSHTEILIERERDERFE
jgi:hypothetical protein